MGEKNVLYITPSSNNPRARMLSNHEGGFTLTASDGKSFEFFQSPEHFIWAILYPLHVCGDHFDCSGIDLDMGKEKVVAYNRHQTNGCKGIERECHDSYNPAIFHRHTRLDIRTLVKASTADNARRISLGFRPGGLVIYLFGEMHPYGSHQHGRMIELAIREKFKQNEKYCAELRETGDMGFYVPDKVKGFSVFSKTRFCQLITTIREEIAYYGGVQ